MTQPGVVRWLGRGFEMRKVMVEDEDGRERMVGGEIVIVKGIRMAGDLRDPLVNLTLKSPLGVLFLTTRELARNVVQPEG